MKRSASAGWGLAVDGVDRSNFGFWSVGVVFSVFGFGGLDRCDDRATNHGGDERLVELRKLGLTFFGVGEAADGKLKKAERLLEHVVLFWIAQLGWCWVEAGELVARIERLAFVVGGWLGCSENELEVVATWSGFSFDNSGFCDRDFMLAFGEKWHGGIDVVEGEGEE